MNVRCKGTTLFPFLMPRACQANQKDSSRACNQECCSWKCIVHVCADQNPCIRISHSNLRFAANMVHQASIVYNDWVCRVWDIAYHTKRCLFRFMNWFRTVVFTQRTQLFSDMSFGGSLSSCCLLDQDTFQPWMQRWRPYDIEILTQWVQTDSVWMWFDMINSTTPSH